MTKSSTQQQDGSKLPALNDKLVASAAAKLDAAKISSLLWGNYMLTIFGVPNIIDGIDFVVYDVFTGAAYDTPDNDGFQ
ncbi:hypothetical protein C7974DRAFT_425187 [Boeremia exigua]|uniref:uncharacterized protein n=1 Tax=Boeremia exigua TaxID=749465 RepID=UPI001E8D9B9A|nr:uncharacterized protein C7974DRAFT_425187 [Boeremia exigua]KAH6625545.1 hypothetical protein C7974DRAFT_425187 [Boeremia exigua]